MAINPQGFQNYLPITVIIFTVLGWIGAYFGAILMTLPAILASFFLGPLAIIVAVPLALASAALVYLAVFFVPIWAIVVGWLMAQNSAHAGATSTSHPMNVQLLESTHPIHIKVNALAQELQLPPIKWLGVFPDPGINAFAMGLRQDEALVGFSRGAVDQLTMDEFDAVMAHELAHIANYDMARMTFAMSIQRSLTWFLGWQGVKQFARWVFTPLSELELMRMSRSREYWADAIGAYLVSPEAMASALRKTATQAAPADTPAGYQHFMFNSTVSSFFATHPTPEKRIAAIEQSTFINRLPKLPPSEAHHHKTEARLDV